MERASDRCMTPHTAGKILFNSNISHIFSIRSFTLITIEIIRDKYAANFV